MRSTGYSKSDASPAQEKKGGGAKTNTEERVGTNLVLTLKKKIQPLILFILLLIKHFLGVSKIFLSSLYLSLYIKIHEGLHLIECYSPNAKHSACHTTIW